MRRRMFCADRLGCWHPARDGLVPDIQTDPAADRYGKRFAADEIEARFVALARSSQPTLVWPRRCLMINTHDRQH